MRASVPTRRKEDDDPGGGNVEDEGEQDWCDVEPARVVPTG
jgi:hypothetical protein